jgi:alpha/beta superfamily hydrolase
LRFNTRGTTSPHGTSEGVFGEGVTERLDLEAALEFLATENLSPVWLVGWSFGTELAIKYGSDKDIAGAILLSPPLHRAKDSDLVKWVGSKRKLVAIVPELDEYLAPKDAIIRFSVVPEAQVIAVDGAKHLWVGELATRTVLNEIVKIAAPGSYPLPEQF